jgi:hypothetical protein
LWDSIFANGGVPPQLWNKTARKTRAKANKIKVSAGQLRSYGMVVLCKETKLLNYTPSERFVNHEGELPLSM